jgi:hypothetical protein
MNTENNIGENGHTSVKVHHAPGGQSSLSLGWEDPADRGQGTPNFKSIVLKKQSAGRRVAPHLQSNICFGDEEEEEQKRIKSSEANIGESNHSSTKVHYAPGGQSNFSLSHPDENIEPMQYRPKPQNMPQGMPQQQAQPAFTQNQQS